jgi:entericidin B
MQSDLYGSLQKDSKMRSLFLLMIVSASIGLAACNTVKGAGEDVSSAGHAVSNTAEDAKH